jgi:hypothetical protein
MPAVSARQARLMNAVAHNNAFAKKVGVSQRVGREFEEADAHADKYQGHRLGQGLKEDIHDRHHREKKELHEKHEREMADLHDRHSDEYEAHLKALDESEQHAKKAEGK